MRTMRKRTQISMINHFMSTSIQLISGVSPETIHFLNGIGSFAGYTVAVVGHITFTRRTLKKVSIKMRPVPRRALCKGSTKKTLALSIMPMTTIFAL